LEYCWIFKSASASFGLSLLIRSRLGICSANGRSCEFEDTLYV
jgi:hypothetical protein